MFLKSVIILFGLINTTLLQTSDRDASDIWGSGENPVNEASFEDIFEGFEVDDLIDDPVGNITVDGCECVPYYLCDNGMEDEPNYDNWKNENEEDSSKKSVECPHYLLKCCDDEDLTGYKKPVKGCGYLNINSEDDPQDSITQFGEFPWTVAIYYATPSNRLIYVCGGSLIHPEVVITAAHCIKKFKEQPRVRAGEWDFANTNEKCLHQDRDVYSAVIHGGYSSASFGNDIALLFLTTPFELAPHINVVCLPPSEIVMDKSKCISNGWGGGVLTKVELPIVPRRQCEHLLRGIATKTYFDLHESLLCAGGGYGKNVCAADDGSPLVCQIEGQEGRYHQVGIDLWSEGCALYRVPGVYTNVALFRNWIEEKLRARNIDIDTYYTY